jgi:hypothetical protein
LKGIQRFVVVLLRGRKFKKIAKQIAGRYLKPAVGMEKKLHRKFIA